MQVLRNVGDDRSMTTSPQRPSITMDLVVLDTPDPQGLADFYAELLGWEVVRSESDWVTTRGGSGTGIAFQLAADLIPPTWPEGDVPQQSHLDLDVANLDEAEAYALSIGARKVPGDVHRETFRVYLDPSGHPFCLCLE